MWLSGTLVMLSVGALRRGYSYPETQYSLHRADARVTRAAMHRMLPQLEDGDRVRAAMATRTESLVLWSHRDVELDRGKGRVVAVLPTVFTEAGLVVRSVFGIRGQTWQPRQFLISYCSSRNLEMTLSMPLDHAVRYGFDVDENYSA